MAELSLRERLQPALLDRLVDDERLITVFEISVTHEQLNRLGLRLQDLASILEGQGLARSSGEAGNAGAGALDVAYLHFSAPVGRVVLSQLKSLNLKPPGAPQGVALESFCGIEAHNVINDSIEPLHRRQFTLRRLREYVCRDLAVLLNSTSLEVSVDLAPLPHVQRSVLNFGMPSLAGRAPTSVDRNQVARTIEAAIRQFEPRLIQVRVLPDDNPQWGDEHQLNFRIDAQLWGQPAPEHLVLHTRISVESGDVSVVDSGSR